MILLGAGLNTHRRTIYRHFFFVSHHLKTFNIVAFFFVSTASPEDVQHCFLLFFISTALPGDVQPSPFLLFLLHRLKTFNIVAFFLTKLNPPLSYLKHALVILFFFK
jgi:hypothetical protein